MAKNVVFESERYEKRQIFKRIGIPLAVVIGAILIAVVVALIVRGGRGKPVSGGEGTPYPYTWTANRNGSVTLVLDRAAAPGYIWSASTAIPEMGIAAKQDVPEGKTQFTLTPKEAGRYVLEFRLQRENDPEDCIFELSALSEATFDGKTTRGNLLSLSGRRLPGIVRGGEDTLCPYLMCQDPDGDLMVVIHDMETVPEEDGETEDSDDAGQEKKPEGWQCETSDETIVEYLGQIKDEETTALYLRAGTASGRTRVRIWKIETGTELTVEFEVDEDGALLPLEHSIRMGSAPTE